MVSKILCLGLLCLAAVQAGVCVSKPKSDSVSPFRPAAQAHDDPSQFSRPYLILVPLYCIPNMRTKEAVNDSTSPGTLSDYSTILSTYLLDRGKADPKSVNDTLWTIMSSDIKLPESVQPLPMEDEHVDLRKDAQAEKCLESVIPTWQVLGRRSDEVTEAINRCFESSQKPYESALTMLDVIFRSSDIKCRDVFAHAVVEDFIRWSAGRKEIPDYIQPSAKLAIFKLMVQQTDNNNLMNITAEAFELAASPEIFIPSIENSLKEKNYKAVADYARMAGLQNSIANWEKLLLFLVIQAKTSVAERFLKRDPEKQKRFVHCLDALVGLDENMLQVLDRFAQENALSADTAAAHRSMIGVVRRFAKLANLSESEYPNTRINEKESALPYDVLRHYNDGDFEEEMLNLVGDTRKLQLLLVRILYYINEGRHRDFAERFNITEAEWTGSLNVSAKTKQKLDSFIENRSGIINDDYYSLPQGVRESIVTVTDMESSEAFLSYVKDADIAGIDAEWSSQGETKANELALIQIALKKSGTELARSKNSRIFLFDIIAMKNDRNYVNVLSALRENFFDNKNLTKIGFDHHHDYEKICKMPGFETIETNRADYVDLREIMLNVRNYMLPDGERVQSITRKGFGLTQLAKMFLGDPLNKSEQSSAWAKRPLTDAQKNYAALDAWCLLNIHELMKKCGVLIDDRTMKKKEKKRRQKKVVKMDIPETIDEDIDA